jgi:DEAD/DEAH box helicase domain-containing protein
MRCSMPIAIHRRRRRWTAWFRLFFPGVAPPIDVNDLAWRSALGAALKKHLLFINLLKLIRGRIVSLAELQEQMQGPLPEAARPHIARCSMPCWCSSPGPAIPVGQPLVTLRVQLWMRELRRMVTQLRSDPNSIELRAESDVRREPGKLYLPLLQCADCHTTGWLSRLPNGQSGCRPILTRFTTPGSPGSRRPCACIPRRA